MSILLPALAVAFAAFCLWLGVRIVNRRERWAKWTLVAVLLGVPVLYLASFGPACWSIERDPMTFNRVAPRIYWPIGWLCWKSRNFRTIFNWYATIRGPDYVLIVPADSSGSAIVGMSRR